MERKIIKQGKGGFTVYLPKKWVDDNGIDENSTVNMETGYTGLLISKNKLGAKTSTRIGLINSTE